MNTVVDIYGRVSTAEQVEGYSLGEQESRLRMFAESQGWTIHDVIMDGGFSGSSLNRPGIQKVIADAQKGAITKVCVYKLDRLSRSQKDTLYLIEDVFIKNGIDFVSMTESLDTSTPLGMAMIGILSVFAQLEREQIKERMALGRDAKVKSGKYHPHKNDALGYVYDVATKTLKRDEYDAMIVRAIFQKYIDGQSETAIAKWLTEQNWHGHDWHARKIKRTLTQPLYIGRQRWKGETIAVEGCPNIISDEVWEQAQAEMARRDRNRQTQPQSAGEHATMLGGIIWCGCCGNRMCGSATGTKWRNYYYYCYSRLYKNHGMKAPECDNKGWNANRLDAVVLDQIRMLKTTRSVNPDSTVQEERTERIKVLHGRLKAIDEQQARLVNLYSLGTIDTELIAKQSASLQKEKDQVSKMLEEAKTVSGTLSESEFNSTVDSICDILDSTDDIREVSPLVRKLIQSVTVTHEDIKITWNFDA